jgi:accessory gene regulator B
LDIEAINMIDNITDKNIIFLQNHGVEINTDDDRAVYKYGLQILYYYIIDLTVIFSLAAIFNKLYETAIMTFIFGLLQVFGGGYHAKTPLKCLLTMIIGAVVGNALVTLMVDQPIFNIITTVVLSSSILILTPVTNEKHPIGKKIKRRSKLIIRYTIILNLTVTVILNYLGRAIEVTIIEVTSGLYLVSVTAAKIRRRISNV